MIRKLLIAPLISLCIWSPVIAIAPATLTVTACGQSDVLSLGNAFLGAAEAVYAADPSAPYEIDLGLAISSLKTALADYNGSSTSCAVISAANAAATIINSVLPGSSAATIATVALAGFDVLMADLAPCAAPANVVAHTALQSNIRGTAAYSDEKAKLSGGMFREHRWKADLNDAIKKAGITLKLQ